MTLYDFLGFYKSRYKELMSDKNNPLRSFWSYDKNLSIVGTFDMQISRLKGDPDVLNLLSLASCFGSRIFPAQLLTPACDLSCLFPNMDFRNNSNLQQDLLPDVARFRWLNSLALNQLAHLLAISRLEDLCLLKVRKSLDGKVKDISIHNSICRRRLETLEDDEREDWIMLAACILGQRLPDIGVQTSPPLGYLHLVKHLDLLIRSSISISVLEAPYGRLCHPYGFVTARFSQVYLTGANAKEAEAMLTLTIQYEMVMQESSWPKDQRSLTLLKSLAVVYWKLGKLEDAAEALESLSESSAELLGHMDDMTVWAAARLRDIRDRKIEYSHYEVNAAVASTTSKPGIMSQGSSMDPCSASTSEDSAAGISDMEWSLTQVAEQSLEEFGEGDEETRAAMKSLADFLVTSRSLAKAGVWFEKLYHAYGPSTEVRPRSKLDALASAVSCYEKSGKLPERLKSLEGGVAVAVDGNRLDTLRLLLAAGADPNLPKAGLNPKSHDHPRFTPLYSAASLGHLEMVKLLIEKGANINAKVEDYFGNALQAASYLGHDKVVQILLDRGGDINAQGGMCSNALLAASSGGLDKVVQILLDKGADFNAQGGLYGNALQAASSGGHDKVVQILLDRGADIDAQGGYFSSALQAASSRGHDKVVQILLDRGADINAQAEFLFCDALQVASSGGHDKVVQILLDRGANINAQGGYFGSALQAASSGGRDKVVQILPDKGAEMESRPSQPSSTTPLLGNR